MKICPNCNEKFDSGKFCKFCGSALQDEVQELYCSNCGIKLDSGAKFCSNCGAKLEQQNSIITDEKNIEKPTGKNESQNISDNEGIRKCPVCHTEFGDSSMFCPKCGAQCGKNTLQAAPLNPNTWTNLSVYSLQMLLSAENKSHNSILQAAIGKRYYFGINVSENDSEAKKFFEKSANQDNAEGLCYLASCYIYGLGTEIDEKKGFKLVEKAYSIDSDDGEILNLLATCYRNGWGTAQNINKAIEYYKEAEWSGDALLSLGVIYFNGESGISENKTLGFQYFEKAAEEGNARAMFNLGFCYENGIACSQNHDKAYSWYQKSSNAGLADGMFKEAVYDFYNNEDDEDFKELSLESIKEASKKGSELAKKWLEENSNNHGQLSQSSCSSSRVVSNHYETSYSDIASTQLFKTLRSLIAEKLEIDENKVLPESSFRDDLQADSLDTYELVYAIEEKIGITIPDEKANEFETVLDAYNYIVSQL